MENYFIHLIFDSVCDASLFIFDLCLTTNITKIKVETIANSRLLTTQEMSFPNPQKHKLTLRFGMQIPKTKMIHEDMAATEEPTIDDKETCFDFLRVMRNAIKLNPNVIHEVAIAKPAKLDTAFPPLKCAYIGQQCPMVAPKGAIINIVKPSWKKFSPKLLIKTCFKPAKFRIRYTKTIGKTVLKASKIMVAAPIFMPKTRPTLVPPEFFDPKSRGSLP